MEVIQVRHSPVTRRMSVKAASNVDINLPRHLLLVALLVAPSMLQAQHAQSQTFDVASIKPQSRLLAGGSWTGTRYYQAGTALRSVIQFAYDLPRVRVDGGPEWLDAVFWEIEAKPPSPATVDEMRAMVKALLTERFTLRTRVETRELSVLDLRVAGRDGRLGANATRPDCTPIGARAIESLREAGEITSFEVSRCHSWPDTSRGCSLDEASIAKSACDSGGSGDRRFHVSFCRTKARV
jgi:hypothetical protein